MPSTPVQKELRRIAADYRSHFILRGLSVCWAAGCLAGLILLGLNHLFGVAIPYSLVILAGLTGLAGAAIVVWRGRTEVALRAIARRIEQDDPRLNSLLLAALEQEPDARTGELNFLQLRVIREALEANRKSPWSQRFAERLFFAQTLNFALFAATVIVFCALGFVRPERHGQILARDFVEITPGNTNLEKGTAVAVVAQFHRPAQKGVALVFRTPSGGEKRVAMARSLNDPLYGFTLPSVDEDTDYFVEFDGARSDQFKLKVFEFPALKRADAELSYPEYTGLGQAKIEDTRRISAVEGTEVQYTFHLNKPVRSAKLVGTNATELVLTNVAAAGASYGLNFQLEESGRYKLELVDEEGRTNKMPSDFNFVALRNEPPKLKLQAPRGDQRISALQEVRFDAETQDDFGVSAFGIAYSMPGRKSEVIELSGMKGSTNAPAKPHQAVPFSWTLDVEGLKAEPGELVTYYLWADDIGPDGKKRRSESDMYFAEIRPFEEIFRPGQGDQSSSSQQQQQQQQNNPAARLLELQKQIVTATWNLQRRENEDKPSPAFKEDATVVRDSQNQAAQQAQELSDRVEDEKSQAFVDQALTAMHSAEKSLASAADDANVRVLPTALEFEQSAYQALLKLQAREYEVSRSRNRSSQSRQSQQQRAQRQLDQLEFKQDENRYETESQASPLQSPEQREALQVLNRLKELARRQEDMTERLKELQTALNEAKTKEEKDELERQLKRLQEEQRQIVQDMDEVRQRMSQPENQSRMAESREQLDQTREQSRAAARQLESRELSQALNSSARAEQQLEQLSDDFRKATANQFSEQMVQMRQQARELDQQQAETAQKLEEMKDSPRRTLSEEGPRKQTLQAMEEQRAGLTNLLQSMRQVTEQAESAEPLLSRQLYETLRRSSQSNPEESLKLATQLLDRNFLPQASEAQRRAGETIRQLREGVERAAESVLGDEAESLRFAQRELQDLANRAEREMQAATGTGGTNGAPTLAAGPTGTNGVAPTAQGFSTNQTAQAGNGPRSGENSQRNDAGASPGDQPADSQQAGAQSQQGSQSGEGQQGSGDQQGQRGFGQGQQGQRALAQNPGQQGQQGQNGQGGQGQGQRQGQGREDNQPGNQQGGPGGERGNFYNQWANGRDGGGTAGGAWINGPLTGTDYTRWSDRMRDIEEVLQDPDLRTEVARIREQARTMRSDLKRHSEPPKWDLVEAEIIKPLRILENRVAEELARRNSREAVVPADRDPVPQKYADAVSRYYERLGKE